MLRSSLLLREQVVAARGVKSSMMDRHTTHAHSLTLRPPHVLQTKIHSLSWEFQFSVHGAEVQRSSLPFDPFGTKGHFYHKCWVCLDEFIALRKSL